MRETRDRLPHTIWAYSYEMVPPLARERLRRIKAFLDHEHARPPSAEGRWEGRLVLEDLVTYVLVVTDGPDQDREINRRLEAELNGINARFSITTPMVVVA